MRAPAACRGQAACDLLVVLDAHALFPIAASYADVMQLMGRMPPLVIVGVPSRTPAEHVGVAQFTTPAGEDERARYPDSGGAPRFLQFLQDEVIPLAASRYRVTTRHVLAGHSLAGLFAVHAVAAGARFESYAAISPTLGWNCQATLNALGRQLGEPNATARRLYVSVAGGDAAGYRDAFDPLEADLSRQRPAWLRTELQRFTAHDHVSTVGPGLIAAMNWLFLTPPPSGRTDTPAADGALIGHRRMGERAAFKRKAFTRSRPGRSGRARRSGGIAALDSDRSGCSWSRPSRCRIVACRSWTCTASSTAL